MSTKRRLNKLEEQSLPPNKMQVWIAIEQPAGSNQYDVAESGASVHQKLNRAEVEALPGARLVINLATPQTEEVLETR
jgi:hypothetical protein